MVLSRRCASIGYDRVFHYGVDEYPVEMHEHKFEHKLPIGKLETNNFVHHHRPTTVSNHNWLIRNVIELTIDMGGFDKVVFNTAKHLLNFIEVRNDVATANLIVPVELVNDDLGIATNVQPVAACISLPKILQRSQTKKNCKSSAARRVARHKQLSSTS